MPHSPFQKPSEEKAEPPPAEPALRAGGRLPHHGRVSGGAVGWPGGVCMMLSAMLRFPTHREPTPRHPIPLPVLLPSTQNSNRLHNRGWTALYIKLNYSLGEGRETKDP